MGRVKIVTDSTADLPSSLVNELDIRVVPLKVVFGDMIYREGLDITVKEFYEKMAASEQLPRTSQPSPGEFKDAYEELTSDGSNVVSIHISARMSGTFQSALMAKNSLPGRDIRVLDSKMVSMALGLVVLAAARAARDGKSVDEVERTAIETMSKVKTYFVVDTLENLAKGGRIGRASALLGTVLNVKPILTFEDGFVTPFERVRGKGKALERIFQLVKEYSQKKGPIRCALVHANALDEAVKFHQKLVSELNYSEHIIGEVGAVVGTHAGAGTIGLLFY
ncbi:MAG: DegV family protein [Peptococcaceae bacterium]|jgi:DegV family protein with EDD domain|nr:DegV family protein [Peptococcaceae bacterium]MDH7525725.1 DegV family protein [Peptococcaceae bacterium]